MPTFTYISYAEINNYNYETIINNTWNTINVSTGLSEAESNIASGVQMKLEYSYNGKINGKNVELSFFTILLSTT